MSGQVKTTEELKNEINALRHRLSELETVSEKYKRVDDTLRFRESILHHMYDAVIVTNLEGKITYWNRGATAVFGFSSAEILGKTPAAIIGFDPGKFQQGLKNMFAGQMYEVQTQGQTKSGNVVDLEIRTSLLVDVERSPLGFVSVIRDITHHKKAEQSLQRRNDELNLLNRAGNAFNSTLDLDEVLSTLLQEVRHFLDVVACSVWLVDTHTNELVCRQVADAASAVLRGHRLAPGQGLAGWVMTEGQSLNITNSQSDPRYYGEIDRKTGIYLKSVLTVPLKVKDRTIGVIQVVDTAEDRFDGHDQMLVESLAAAAAAAIENARLYEQAAQDARTKSLLLEEVNHRVKNNLAAIIGLLYAEQRQLEKDNRPEMRGVLQEMITRIQGLATVHRMLSVAEWSPLPMGDLVMQVIQSVVATSQHGRLAEIIVSPCQTRVVAAQASSLALVINELTTNSLKYALPAVTHLIIEVTITEDGQGIVLTYQDNGPGFPENVLTSDEVNMGLYLVKTLVQEDLMGSATLANDQGAVITIRFAPSAS